MFPLPLPSLISLAVVFVVWILIYIAYLYWSHGPWNATVISFWCRFESRLEFPERLLVDVIRPIIHSFPTDQETKQHMQAVVCIIAQHIFRDMDYVYEKIMFVPDLIWNVVSRCVKRILF